VVTRKVKAAMATAALVLPRKTFKQKVTDEVGRLQVRCSTDGVVHLVSSALWNAMEEIMDELLKPRTNWKLIAALTGVKSYISNGPKGPDGLVNHFWSKLVHVDDPYSVLDDLHHRVCRKVRRLPSGMTEVTTMGSRHGEVDTSVSSTSPTLSLIAQEREANAAWAKAARDAR
jgi:hypothetical protein